ncbi:MAG: hypothetical protein AAFX94_02940, partial [Myxococcota bacterium]
MSVSFRIAVALDERALSGESGQQGKFTFVQVFHGRSDARHGREQWWRWGRLVAAQPRNNHFHSEAGVIAHREVAASGQPVG